jgi:hypothetical protein
MSMIKASCVLAIKIRYSFKRIFMSSINPMSYVLCMAYNKHVGAKEKENGMV